MSHVELHVFRVPRRAVGSAMLRMAVARRRLPGVKFAKFLGTGTGLGFGPGDADLTRYAVLTVSDRPVRLPAWERIAERQARIDLEPLVSRGAWAGQSPFEPTGGRADGPVLALTRARLRPSRALRFWRAVPPIAKELAVAPGLLARFGVGEAPIGWQGTVSVWRSTADLTAFAYRQPEHRAAVKRTPTERWYAEELFARFAVRGISGDRSVLGWVDEEIGEGADDEGQAAAMRLVAWQPDDLLRRLDDVVSVYGEAMGYRPELLQTRRGYIGAHVRRAGFRAVATLTTEGRLAGFGYGYRSGPGQWWHDQVRAALDESARQQWLSDCFEVVELHVRPGAQGHGVGARQLRALLAMAEGRTVLLSTPEADEQTSRAWRLYRRFGFTDVLRDFIFPGDERAFAILGRGLPVVEQPAGETPGVVGA